MVPHRDALEFSTAAAAGNRIELVSVEERGHGFFNHGRGDGRDDGATVDAADRFLASVGWLEGEPTVFSE